MPTDYAANTWYLLYDLGHRLKQVGDAFLLSKYRTPPYYILKSLKVEFTLRDISSSNKLLEGLDRNTVVYNLYNVCRNFLKKDKIVFGILGNSNKRGNDSRGDALKKHIFGFIGPFHSIVICVHDFWKRNRDKPCRYGVKKRPSIMTMNDINVVFLDYFF